MDYAIQRHVAILSLIIAGSLRLENPAQGQIMSDGTLPTVVSSPDRLNFAIDGGSRSGSNLFHSFSQFSVPTGGTAVFNNPTDVRNIFSRVTGGTVSNIDSLIQAQGGANFFLLNPSGIVFGPNAKLNIGGSFLSATASNIQFADGVAFDATNPTPLLTMSVPIGLQMGPTPSAIVNRAAGAAGYQGYPVGLKVNRGQMLALIGGDLLVDGGGMQATEGVIALGSLDANQMVKLTSKPVGWNFDYSAVSKFRDIVVQKAMLDTNGNGAGSIEAVGQNILIRDGGRLMARNLTNTTRNAQGSIRLQASDSIEVKSGFPFPGSGCTNAFCNSLISTTTLAKGQGGDVFMTASNIRLLDGGQIGLGNRGSGAGNSGKLTIQGENIELRGAQNIFYSGIFNSVSNGASGKGGDVEITARQLRLLGGGAISVASSSSFGSNRPGENLTATGSAGTVKIIASDLVEVSGSGRSSTGGVLLSGIRADVSSDARGAGGRIEIATDRLLVRDQGNITTTTASKQSNSGAGNIEITAKSIILKNRGTLQASSVNGGEGNIKITANTVLLRSLAEISTTASGDSNGGNISINSQSLIGLENSDIIANAGKGRGGNININTQGIIGLEFRNTLTPRTDLTNDITASSQFNINGTVDINNIGMNPNSGLIGLPVDTVDPSQKIATSCGTQNDSSFVATGRGGMPESPMQIAKLDRTWSDLRTIADGKREPAIATASMPIEATALVTNAQGEVELVGEGAIASKAAGVTCSRQ